MDKKNCAENNLNLNEMKLPAGVYVIASLDELKEASPNSLRRFGLDLVVWKHSLGKWFAHEDRCPHRSAKLSLGQIKSDTHGNTKLICPFHGFEFDTHGTCSFIPETGQAASNLRMRTWQLSEQFGYLWINWNLNADSVHEIPWFTNLDIRPFAYGQSIHIWKTHFSRCVENQLDYAHLPFVHKTTIGRGFDPKRKVEWHLNQKSLKVYVDKQEQDAGYFEFRFANIWRLMINPKFVQTLAFVPVDENETRLYVRAYVAISPFYWLNKLLAWVSSKLNATILKQDHDVVLSQLPKNTSLATEEKLVSSDRAVRAFREWLSSSENRNE